MEYNFQNNKRIALGTAGIESVFANRITHIVSESPCVCKVYFIDKLSPVVLGKYLNEFEKELSTYGFLKINFNTLMNPEYIENVQQVPCKVTLKNNVELSISMRQWQLIKNSLNLPN